MQFELSLNYLIGFKLFCDQKEGMATERTEHKHSLCREIASSLLLCSVTVTDQSECPISVQVCSFQIFSSTSSLWIDHLQMQEERNSCWRVRSWLLPSWQVIQLELFVWKSQPAAIGRSRAEHPNSYQRGHIIQHSQTSTFDLILTLREGTAASSSERVRGLLQ